MRNYSLCLAFHGSVSIK
uniref:Uncharacterized protein n=1 Tax=Lepeophtheirus salmonis TaxID=72036 RepID=A0A0K2UUG8_LEPSM